MTIEQTVTIKSSAEKVYNAIMTASEFAEVTGAPADIAADEGGTFSCFGGQVVGRHIELVPNQRIVQAWRVGPARVPGFRQTCHPATAPRGSSPTSSRTRRRRRPPRLRLRARRGGCWAWTWPGTGDPTPGSCLRLISEYTEIDETDACHGALHPPLGRDGP